MSVSYGGDSITFADSSTISSGWTGFKNRFINGGMVIDQRNAGAALTGVGSTAINFAVDRTMFLTLGSGDGRVTIQRSSDAPTGFSNSMYSVVTTTDTSLTGYEGYSVQQKVEGYNIADFGFGAQGAQTITVSFWVKSSLVGNYSFTAMNDAGSQCYTSVYTINSANTWEYKTITIPGSTSGGWYKDNNAGLYCVWGLGGATNRTATSTNTWTAGPAGGYTPTQASGCVSWIGTSGATFYITGIQLEKGSTASSFEYRPYTTELQLCQRYCQQFTSPGQVYFTTGHVWSSTLCQYSFLPKVQMRTHPALETGGTLTNLSGQSGVNLSGISLDGSGYYVEGQQLKINGNMSSSSYTSGYSCALLLNSNGAYIRFNAEL